MISYNKYKPITLLLFLILGLIGACKKESDVCVNGQVLNTYDNSPVAGALVRITGYEGSYLGSTSSYVEAETKTDSEGKYSFKYKEKNKYSYRVSTSHPKYFFDLKESEIVLSSSSKQKANLYLIPEAWVKLYAKRVSKGVSCFFPSSNSITVNDTSGIYKFIQKYRDAAGESFIYYSIRFSSNQGSYDEDKKKAIQLKPFDTTEIHIEW